MTKKFNSQDSLIIAILILLSVVAWIGTSAYHVFVDKKKNLVDKSILEKLDPRLNGEIIDTLAGKRYLEEDQLIKVLSEINSAPTVVPTPSLSPTPINLSP